jgi:site-specific DNA-methyltransferase (adenine-specific)
MKARIMVGDCRTRLGELAENSVDAIVTDPPYHLTTGKKGGSGEASVNLESPYGRARVTTGFMGMTWDGGDVAHSVEMWAQCLRVLKPGGYLLAFGGSRTYHRLACAVEDAGFEIRDQIMWLYGSGFPKSLNLGDGRGTALKPAHEPIVVARKPLIGTVAANFERWGTGALNIDAYRIGTEGGSSEPDGGGIHRYNKMLNEQGYRPSAYQPTRDGESSAEKVYAGEGGTNFAMKPGPRGGDPCGRWPANVIHDGSEEVTSLLPSVKSGSIEPHHVRHTSKTVTVYGERRAPEIEQTYGDSGSAARFFYAAKADKAEREEGCYDLAVGPLAYSNQAQAEVNRGNIEHTGKSGINTVKMRGNTHPTVKPVDLMRYLVRLVTPKGGLVLDPFTGSGTTGVAALLEGMDFVGMEITPDYVAIAERRLKQVDPLLNTVEVSA